jgi:RNA polymerase sigma-70 factor, ECF subfamily
LTALHRESALASVLSAMGEDAAASRVTEPGDAARAGDGDGEREILAALDRGDRDRALTALMRELGAPVFRYCRQLVGDRALAEDVHQVVFADAYEHFGTFERRSSLRSWIFTIAHHRCLDVIKARRRWRERFASEASAPEAVHPEPPVDEHLGATTLGRGVADCLQRLQPHVRMAVMLRYQEGFACDEIARMSRERAGTVQARIARAMPLLRQCLEDKGLVP